MYSTYYVIHAITYRLQGYYQEHELLSERNNVYYQGLIYGKTSGK